VCRESAEELWCRLRGVNERVEGLLRQLGSLAQSDGARFQKATSWLASKPLAACEASCPAQYADVAASVAAIARAMQEVRGVVTQSSYSPSEAAVALQVRTLLRSMGEGAGVPIEPACQTQLVDATAAMPGVVAAGVPGAGAPPTT
jgi:phosphomevalonate kinase